MICWEKLYVFHLFNEKNFESKGRSKRKRERKRKKGREKRKNRRNKRIEKRQGKVEERREDSMCFKKVKKDTSCILLHLISTFFIL